MNLRSQAGSLVQKIKSILISHLGKILNEATSEEFYYAFCFALREEIMINWTAQLHSFTEKKSRVVYYLSLEYLPGRFLSSNISNINMLPLVQQVLELCNRNYPDLIAAENDPGLGNGGLGRLASCFLDSLATLQYPAWGYGLRYQYGIFEQEIWNGQQVERPDRWLLANNPWEFRKDNEDAAIQYHGHPIPATNSHGDEVHHLENFEEVRALPFDIPIIGYPKEGTYGVVTLRLWSTKESPRNFALQRYNAGFLDQAAENASLTDVLYPSDHHDVGKRIRLKQEFLLSSASLHDIIRRHVRQYKDLKDFKDKVRIQINDTHPALVIPELVRILTTHYDISFTEAWEITQQTCSYTNHTILKEALEEWNEERMRSLLPRQYHIIQKLNATFCSEIRTRFPQDEEKLRRLSIIQNGQIRMAHLCIYGSHKVNGVAELHTEILQKKVFADFVSLYPERFINVTNGVTQRKWIKYANPLLSEFLHKKLGEAWITDFSLLKNLRECLDDEATLGELLDIKKKNKERLKMFLEQQNPIRDTQGHILCHTRSMETDCLYDIQIKRIHEYKRPLMNLLHLLMMIQEIEQRKEHPYRIKRQIIIAGKAAPGYENAKRIIQLAYAIHDYINQKDLLKERFSLCFVENYNVTKAEVLIPGADLSQQISVAGMEASGTGNMKLAMNGALTIGTDDGANIEMRKAVTDAFWPFKFGASSEEIEKQRSSYKAQDIYEKDPQIQAALDMLKNGSLARNEQEAQNFHHLFQSLLSGFHHQKADPFFVLYDLRSYYEAQKKVEELFHHPLKWAKYTLANIAGMGEFSTDVSIKNYAQKIWDIKPCPTNAQFLHKVQNEYFEKDRCPISIK